MKNKKRSALVIGLFVFIDLIPFLYFNAGLWLVVIQLGFLAVVLFHKRLRNFTGLSRKYVFILFIISLLFFLSYFFFILWSFFDFLTGVPIGQG